LGREHFVLAAAKMTIVGDKRHVPDRRISNQPYYSNRRYRPCRRLNNISVKEVHMDTFIRPPYLWLAFRMMGYKKKDR
jgi:hypothetical protein